MSNELIVIEAVKEVCNTVNTLVSTNRASGVVRKGEVEAVKIQVEKCLRITRGKAMNEIVNNNLMCIKSTCDLIDSLNFTGRRLEAANAELENLIRGLNELSRGF